MTNRLARATSPYLQQHQDNPVDWFEWDADALELARSSDKPILLSIGYAACHWCHVMAHESFEDPATADLMNQLYVNIKVDREERPDLDKVYQLAHQALTRRGGGWPLTLLLNPHTHMPFFAGTYFPPQRRHGLPSFKELLVGARQWFVENPSDIAEQDLALRKFLAAHASASPQTEAPNLSLQPVHTALASLAKYVDLTHGGLGHAPKFPHAPDLRLLLALHQRLASSRDAALPKLDDKSLPITWLRTTLDAMQQGGLNDHLAGGFYRYCVDAHWGIPHFEKMLYDNALLLPLYAQAAVVFDSPQYAQCARSTVQWLLNEMRDANGGFYSSLDADSEGEEGKFYVWQRSDFDRLLSREEAQLASAAFGLDQPANFEEEHWHLQRRKPLPQLAQQLQITAEQAEQRLESARSKLLTERATRVRPGLDDKQLTAWNALMISALARAGAWLEDSTWCAAAQQALDFVQQQLWRDGRLLVSHRAGVSALPAYLDDYSYLLEATLEVIGNQGNPRLVDFACALADALLEHFFDTENGGFFFTAHDHEQLIQRPRTFTDDAIPNGNAVAIRALHRLGTLIGESRYTDAVETSLRAASADYARSPHACMSGLIALSDVLAPAAHLVLRCSASELPSWQAHLQAERRAGVEIYVLLDDSTRYPGLLGAMRNAGPGMAYRCAGTQCGAPYGLPG